MKLWWIPLALFRLIWIWNFLINSLCTIHMFVLISTLIPHMHFAPHQPLLHTSYNFKSLICTFSIEPPLGTMLVLQVILPLASVSFFPPLVFFRLFSCNLARKFVFFSPLHFHYCCFGRLFLAYIFWAPLVLFGCASANSHFPCIAQQQNYRGSGNWNINIAGISSARKSP